MSFFAQLRDIIGERKTKEVVKKLGGKCIRIRSKLDLVKLKYVEKKEKFDKMTIKDMAKALGCSWAYARDLRCMLGNNSRQKKT